MEEEKHFNEARRKPREQRSRKQRKEKKLSSDSSAGNLSQDSLPTSQKEKEPKSRGACSPASRTYPPPQRVVTHQESTQAAFLQERKRQYKYCKDHVLCVSSCKLHRKSAPWAYERGARYRSIGALELVANPVGLIVFCDELSKEAA
eukprot:6018630-Amphidinium_carterae.1